jgi:hypothetical protein
MDPEGFASGSVSSLSSVVGKSRSWGGRHGLLAAFNGLGGTAMNELVVA